MSAQRPVPRIGLTRAEAAEALGVGLTTFKTQIQPELKVWRCGKLRVFPVAEIERWLDEHCERVIDDDR